MLFLLLSTFHEEWAGALKPRGRDAGDDVRMFKQRRFVSARHPRGVGRLCHLASGFLVYVECRNVFGTLRLNLRLVRAFAKSRCIERAVSSTEACDYVQIRRLPFLNGGLLLELEVLQWSKLVETRKTQKLGRKTPPS